MKILYVIPARGGSKGIPGKNIKPLAGKPLLYYTIDAARSVAEDKDICLSSNDSNIIEKANLYGLEVPFVRPDSLATDTAGTHEVLSHCIDFYENLGKTYDAIVLLQPTSPFRKKEHILEAISLLNRDIDMVVSCCESKSNPYYNMFEEDENQLLVKSKPGNFTRRQDCPKVYEYNGSIYVVWVDALKKKKLHQLDKRMKYLMEEKYSVDIDNLMDWAICESLLETRIIELN